MLGFSCLQWPLFSSYHLNQLSRQYLEESLAMEEKRHLNSLTKANRN